MSVIHWGCPTIFPRSIGFDKNEIKEKTDTGFKRSWSFIKTSKIESEEKKMQEVLNFIIKNILTQASVVVGLIALLGLVLQKNQLVLQNQKQ